MSDNKDNKTTQVDESQTTVEQSTTETPSIKKTSLCNGILGKSLLFIILAIFCIGEIAVLVLIFMLFLSFYVAIIIGGAIGISSLFIIKTIKERKAKKTSDADSNDDIFVEEVVNPTNTDTKSDSNKNSR